MVAQLLLIVDNTDLNATYEGGQWSADSWNQWYDGTIIWPPFADSSTSTSTGSLSLSFEGIAIAFAGNTPGVFGDSQTLIVSIDGAPPYNTSYNDPTPQSYVQWYQSPALPEGTHNITLAHMCGTALDYAVITAGQNTPLSGKTIVVDNEDASIGFTGFWKRNTDRYQTGYPPAGYPFHNSTHRSTTPGDIFAFRFSGTSLNIYGILNWAIVGTVSVTYTLDGSPTPQTYSVTTSSPMFQSNALEQVNFPLFNYATLPAGDHTLVVNVTNCVNQTFIFDYMTYQPSFSTLATMPNLPLPASSDSTNGTSVTATSTPVGPIVGVVLGGIAFLLLLIGGFLWFRKKKPRDDSGELNQIVTFLPLPLPSGGQENLGTARGITASPGAPISSPSSSASIPGFVSTTLLQTGPPGIESPGSVGGETIPTWPGITDISTSGAEPITAEMREAQKSVAPPAYETVT